MGGGGGRRSDLPAGEVTSCNQDAWSAVGGVGQLLIS